MKWILLSLLLIFLSSKLGKKLLKFIISVLVVAGVIYLVFTWCGNSLLEVFDGDVEARDKAIASMVEQAKDKDAWMEVYNGAKDNFMTSEMYEHIQHNFDNFKDTFVSK